MEKDELFARMKPSRALAIMALPTIASQMIDDGRFIPYEKSLIDLLLFRKDHRGAHTRPDLT